LVFFGLISYSLYLFHWPILSFYRHITGYEGSLLTRFALILLSLILAVLSWRYVEMPFRRRRSKTTKLRFFVASGAVVSAFLVVGFIGNFTEGAKFRYDYRFDPYAVMREAKGQLTEVLDGVSCRVVANGEILLEGLPCEERIAEHPKVALLGDSHAAHLYPGLADAFPGLDFYLYSTGGCRALLHVVTRTNKAGCDVLVPYVFDVVVPEQDFDAIILAGRWREPDIPAIAPTLEYLESYTDNLVVVGPVPQYRSNLPELLAIWPGEYNARFFQLNKMLGVDEIDSSLAAVVSGTDAGYISLYQGMCHDETCSVLDDDGSSPLQWDYGHLTVAGSEFVGSHILAPQLRRIPVFGDSVAARQSDEP
jgi:hypothetical protein